MLLAIFCIYWTASILMLVFTRFIYKKKLTHAKKVFLQPGKIVGVAHRGGMLESYDNSLSAFEYSVKMGIKMVEMDVYKTKDGKYLVIHDHNLTRITGQNISVKEINYEDIQPYQDEIYCDYGLSFRKANAKKEKPCTLDQFFEFVKRTNIIVNLDVKTGCKDDLDKIIGIAVKEGIAHRIVSGMVNGFDPNVYRAKYMMDLDFFFPLKSSFLLFFYFFTGILPFIPLKYDFLNVPLYFKTLQNSNLFKTWTKSRLLIRFFHQIKPLFSIMIWHLHERGIPTIYFIVNEVEDFELAIACGGKGLMTDRPEKLMNFLKKKGYN